MSADGPIVRLVRKQAMGSGDLGDTGSGPSHPSAAGIRREVDALSRCEAPGIVQLIGFGEQPRTWLETREAGAHTLASPPPGTADRLAALAATAHVLAGLHRRGWVHLSLRPDHVIWRRSDARGTPVVGPVGAIEVTLCSLGSAVCPAGPAERAADREALAAIMAAMLIAPGSAAFEHEFRTALAGLAVDLNSGDLDDLDALAAGLDDLSGAAMRSCMAETSEPLRSRPDRFFRQRLAQPVRTLSSRPFARLGLATVLGVATVGCTAALVSWPNPDAALGRSAGSASSARCARPAVPPPRVDPEGRGCGQPVGYRSSVLTVGTDRWSLGDDIVDGQLVDLDGDGWSELAALRNDGEVFLVRRFPTSASDAVQVRSVATAQGAERLVESSPGSGLDGLKALGADGKAVPMLPVGSGSASNSALSAPTGPTTVGEDGVAP